MKKDTLSIIVSFFLCGLFCTTDENYNSFKDHFYNDPDFQKERVQFPISGIHITNESAGTSNDSIVLWTRENWVQLKTTDLDSNEYECNTIIAEDSVIEKISGKGFGFAFEVRFVKIKGKWFLTYIRDVLM